MPCAFGTGPRASSGAATSDDRCRLAAPRRDGGRRVRGVLDQARAVDSPAPRPLEVRPRAVERAPPPASCYSYTTPLVSATTAGGSPPPAPPPHSLVMRTPPSFVSSALTRRCRRRTRAPAGTGLMKRTLFDP